MAFDIEFTDSRQSIAVDDISMSDSAGGRMEITGVGDRHPTLVWSKQIISQVTVTGIPLSMVPPQVLPKMKKGNLLGLIIRLGNGRVFRGEIGIDSVNTRPEGKGKPNLVAVLSGTFTGEKIEDDEKPFTARTIGTKVDLYNGSSYTIGYQDSRMDAAVRPFFVDNVYDSTTSIPVAIQKVVNQLGGNTHTHPYDDTLHIMSASGQRFDSDSVVGAVQYARGPRDCSPAAPSVTIGYEEKRIRVTRTIDGADGDWCGSVAIRKTIKVRVPVLSIRVPCVWTDFPTQPDTLGFTNANIFSIFGIIGQTHEIKSDGFDFNPYDSPSGIYYVGTIRYQYRPGGWTKGSLTCIAPVQLPLEGNQTQPGYTMQASFQQYYEYETTTFPDLYEICPNCYTNESP